MSNITQTYQNLRTSQKFQRRFSLTVRLIVALILIFFSIFPVLWIISASLSSTQSLSTQTIIPERASLINYQRLFGRDPDYKFGDLVFGKWIFNS
jgi:ABC-type maltose transport system permease subunit